MITVPSRSILKHCCHLPLSHTTLLEQALCSPMTAHQLFGTTVASPQRHHAHTPCSLGIPDPFSKTSRDLAATSVYGHPQLYISSPTAQGKASSHKVLLPLAALISSLFYPTTTNLLHLNRTPAASCREKKGEFECNQA